MNPRVCLVTGASRGIGRAIAEHLARVEKGILLVLTYKADDAAADDVRLSLESLGAVADVRKCDVSDGAAVAALIAAVKGRYGRLDVLVNNAGITADGSFIQSEPSEIRRVVDTNLRGTLQISLAVLPLLLESKGAIVMVSSIAAVKGKEGQAIYSATKGAILGLTRLLARRCGPRGVRVNAVAPGFVNTDMVTQLEPEVYGHVLRGTTLRRVGEPAEIASVVHFLSSPQSAYINGTVIPIDGGLQK